MRFRSLSAAFVLVAVCATFFTGPLAFGQETRRRAGPPQGYRRLMPGVETTIPVQWDPTETVSFSNIVEILAIPALNWTPQTISKAQTARELATRYPLRRDVWNLEFSFLPMRMVRIDLPDAGGRPRPTMVWYMVYRVTNRGGHLRPTLKDDGTWDIQKVDYPVSFEPSFTLHTPELRKSYRDKVIPLAIDPIRRREDPRRELLTSAQMLQRQIELTTETKDNSVWGVATWESGFESGDMVDPRTDYFSVYVAGLSNAYRFADPAGAYKAGDPPATGRLYRRKTLQLNFWRPSDEFSTAETEIYLGTPASLGIEGRIDYQWVFR